MFIDPILYPGAPADTAGRDAAELRCYALLERLGIPFWRCDHERADTLEDCRAVERVLGASICKNLLLTNRQQTEYYLLIMPSRKPFKTRLLSQPLGTARLSFAPGEQMEPLLGTRPGSASLLGLMNDPAQRVRLVLDREVLAGAWFCCHPCRNTASLRLDAADVRARLLPALGHEPAWVDLPWDVE